MVNVTIGLLMRLTSQFGPLGDFWDGVGCAAVLALRHANERNGAIVPQFAGLTRTVYDVRTADSSSQPIPGIRAYRELTTHFGASAIVGAARSAVSSPIAHIGGCDHVPQLSYWSSSPALSNKEDFPYFGRTFVSDGVTGAEAPHFLRFFNWTNVAVLHVIDPYASGYVEVFTARMTALGMSVISIATWLDGDAAGARDAVARTAATGANVRSAAPRTRPTSRRAPSACSRVRRPSHRIACFAPGHLRAGL